MNAVERLLAHGEKLLTLYDEMYRDRNPDDWSTALFWDPSAEKLPSAFSGEPWWSPAWWEAAVHIAFGQSDADFSTARASAIYRDRLAQRQHLLDRHIWQRMVADVVQECRAWDFLAKKVVRLAQEVADSAIRIEEHVDHYSSASDWKGWRYGVHRDLGLLARYIKPPAAAGSSPTRQTSSSTRPAAGGRPKKYSDKLRQAIIADRKKEERKKNPQPLKTWLTSWANDHDMKRADALKMYNAEMAAIRRAQEARSR
jgi:hypothetical protein